MKKYLLTGMVILTPVALTLIVIYFLFDFFSNPFISLVNQLVAYIEIKFSFKFLPGVAVFVSRILSLLLICVLILLLGIFGRWFFIRTLLKWTNSTFERIPLINSVYKITRDIIAAVFGADGKKVFQEPVMIPFPNKPNYSIGFRSGKSPIECEEKLGCPLVTVFCPTAPHPISGFLFILPKDEIHSLDMTNEDAFKYLVSCGVILPPADLEEEKNDSF